MEILEGVKTQIQNFFLRNVAVNVQQRGKSYFLEGRVLNNKLSRDRQHLMFNVLGSQIYTTELGFKFNSDYLIEYHDCTCPYSGWGACKHIVASVFWVQAHWDFVAAKMTDSQLVRMDEINTKPAKNSAIKKPAKEPDFWEILNFQSFTKTQLNTNSQYQYWNPNKLQSLEMTRKDDGHFQVFLGFSSVYSDTISEKYSLDIRSDNTNLKITCSCSAKGKNFCAHAYSFFAELTDHNQMYIFLEPSPEELDEQGRLALKSYGLNPDADWKEYFTPGFIDNEKRFIPNEKVANLISPLNWKLDSSDAIFSGNPTKELNAGSGDEDEKSFEIGFFFRFSLYDGDFHFEPFGARESRKGEPMSINFKKYEDLRYADHVFKRSTDIPLLSLCTSLDDGFSRNEIDEKLSYFNGYAEEIANHPYVYFNAGSNQYQLRKGDLTQIHFHPKTPRIKYILTEKEDYISIYVCFQLFEKDISINDEKLEWVHPHFLKVSDHLFFIPNGQDVRHIESAKQLDGKMISVNMLPELFEKYLSQALRKSDVEFIDFKKYKVSNQTLTAVSKEIYLSEIGNFVLFRPFIRYENDQLLDALSQESQWEVGENGILKTEQDTAVAQEFREELAAMHPEFQNQFNRTDYLHIGYKELLKDNLFLNLFAEFEKREYKVFGVRDLKGLKVNPYPGKVIYSVKSGIDWFEVEAKIVFGDQEISIEQLKKRFKPGSDYIELGDGSRGLIPQEWIKKLERLFQHGELKGDKLLVSNKKFNIVDDLFDELEDDVTALIQDKRDKLLSFDKIQKYPLPTGIKGTLRHYQEDGFQWLCFLDEFQWGGILADDMGLGKTLQIITFLKHILIKNKQANLIIVPTSLLFNWENEIKKFAPSLNVHFYYGAQRIKSTDDFKKYDIVFTSYGHALSDVEILKEYTFNYVILDESQAIKNPASKRFKAVRLLKANNRIAMTGTPIENNTFDLYAQMSFLNPGFLGSAKSFKTDFAKAIDTDRDEIKAAELQRLIKPFVLRRTKTQVATELPDKTEEVLYCEMDKTQQKVYDAFRNEYRQRLIEKIDEEGVSKARFAVLEGLTKLRQICDTPEILPGEEKYTGKSVKTDLLMMHIKEKTANHKILIFSQFVKMLRVIECRIKQEGISYEYLDGQSSTTQRQASVEHFQNDESCRVFLISLKAGGTGLNLMAADYVYLVDPWWNPAVENQAIDRCYRIGQDKKVIAYRMICKNTVEEKIMELQKKKKSIAGDIVTTDEGVLKKLQKEDLIGLFG